MKKKKSPIMGTEKGMAKLMEEIQKQNFDSKEELEAFLQKMVGKNLDDLPDRTDNKGRAQDLVYEAYEQPDHKAKKMIKQALKLDPDNVEAYNYLASKEDDLGKAIELYEKAVKAGEKTLGKEFFEREKGYFWGLLETRPYMRAKAGLADCYYLNDEIDKAIEIYEEMLELNPNDNQGIRYILLNRLIINNDLSKFKKYARKYREDNADWNFNNALYQFKKSGPSEKSHKALSKAHRSNEYVIDFLIGIRELPEELPHYYSMGDENEAILYVYDTWPAWQNTEGALKWLVEFKLNRLNIN